MREQYMRTGEGFLLVYSIASRQSFEEIMTFQQQILRVKDKDYFPMILVGNKCDLETEREVSTQGVCYRGYSLFIYSCSYSFLEGEAVARRFGCKFIETSAKSRLRVEDAFYDTVREIRRYNREMSSQTPGTSSGYSPNGHGPVSKMELNEDDQEPGCCGKCVMM